jgi:hypothetical protein
MKTNQSDIVFELIAERELEQIADDEKKSVFVRIGKPYIDGEAWACPYQITGIGSESIRPIFGQDAVQAIQLAMFIIHSELEVLGRETPLTFLGETNLDFPKSARGDDPCSNKDDK